MIRLLLLLSLLLACESEIGPTPPAAVLGFSGRAQAANENPIANAIVQVRLLRGRVSVPACTGDDVAGPQVTRTDESGLFYVKLVDYDMIGDTLCAHVQIAERVVTVAIPQTRFRIESHVNAQPRDTLHVVLVLPPA
jgi:hypothetical protein